MVYRSVYLGLYTELYTLDYTHLYTYTVLYTLGPWATAREKLSTIRAIARESYPQFIHMLSTGNAQVIHMPACMVMSKTNQTRSACLKSALLGMRV